MSTTVTVRKVDKEDKAWLEREARRLGVSMEEFVRRLIREKREKAKERAKPSEIFKRHFGPEGGIDLPPRAGYGYQPLDLTSGKER